MTEGILRPINWAKLRTDEAERLIRERAANTDNVIFGDHAYEREEDREILSPDVYRILVDGYVEPNLELTDRGEWKAVVSKKLKGERKAAVVTIILNNSEKLFLKTIMWRDI